MFSKHARRGGIGNYSLLCCFHRRLFVLLSSRLSSIVIALGWERVHAYRSWRRAANMPALKLNISSSGQPSPPLLWSESGRHTLRRPATHPYLYVLFEYTSTSTQRRYKSFLSCIDPASTEWPNCTFVPFFKCFKTRSGIVKWSSSCCTCRLFLQCVTTLSQTIPLPSKGEAVFFCPTVTHPVLVMVGQACVTTI